MPPTVRAATAADEAAVLDLTEELLAPPGGRPPFYTRTKGAAAFAHAVTAPDAAVLLALDGVDAVGFVSVYRDIRSIRFGPRCWVEDLVVTAARRSQGIGAALLAAADAWARAHGCTHLELASGTKRTDAHRFYRAQGMREESLLFTRWLA